jgi:hypothetical protein
MTRQPAGVGLRLGAALAALLCGAAAVLLVADLLRKTPGPSGGGTAAPATSAAPAPAASAVTPSFPAPPPDAVVFGRQAGDDAVGLAARPGAAGTVLQVSVVGPGGGGVSGLSVVLEPSAARPVEAQPCGAGCYRGTTPGTPRAVTVLIGEGTARALSFVLPRPWPPPGAAALVARAGRVWRRLRTLVSHERLASNPRNAVTTRWRYVAPSGFAYDIAGGASAVVIGARRWDRGSPKARWRPSAQDPPLPQPVPPWTAVRDAHVVGSGPGTWRVTFFDPGLTAWFALVLDRATMRTLDLHMVTTAHFMHDVYGPFNTSVRLRPPA